MTADEFRSVVEFEHGLKVGDHVRVNWTNCGRYWSGLATVHKINAQSIIVTLNEEVGGPGYYPAGNKIKAPRLAMGSGMKLWSANNRVEPISAEVTK